MSWNAGVYTRENPTYSGDDVWQQDAANGFQVISASRHDAHDQDLAEGINACLAKDGTNAMTGDLNLGGNAIINAGLASVDGDVALLGQTITNISFSAGTITFTRNSMADFTLTLATLGLVVGADIQAYDADLTTLGGLAKTDGNFIVANGSTWVVESGATARASLGLGSLATASSVNDTNWSGTDLSIANGGTGSSTASGARSNLGLSGATTVSSSAPSGGSNGDVWFQV